MGKMSSTFRAVGVHHGSKVERVVSVLLLGKRRSTIYKEAPL